MKKGKVFFLNTLKALLIMFIVSSVFSACSNKVEINDGIKVIDSNNTTLTFESEPNRVVILQASLGSAWQLAGGEFIGITSDYEDYGLSIENAEIIGTTKAPSIEIIVSLKPDLIIYSNKIAAQVSCADTLSSLGYKTFAAHIDNFDDYLFCLEQFSILTKRNDLYKLNGTDVKNNIQEIINKVPNDNPKVMFIRAYSSGYNILSSGNIVCDILNDLKCYNIVEDDTDLTRDVSLEVVLKEDPEYVFIVYMGTSNVKQTEEYLKNNLYSMPYWQNIKAYKENKIYVLPSDLFHFKPNNRWGESYQYLYEKIYN